MQNWKRTSTEGEEGTNKLVRVETSRTLLFFVLITNTSFLCFTLPWYCHVSLLLKKNILFWAWEYYPFAYHLARTARICEVYQHPQPKTGQIRTKLVKIDDLAMGMKLYIPATGRYPPIYTHSLSSYIHPINPRTFIIDIKITKS